MEPTVKLVILYDLLLTKIVSMEFYYFDFYRQRQLQLHTPCNLLSERAGFPRLSN